MSSLPSLTKLLQEIIATGFHTEKPDGTKNKFYLTETKVDNPKRVEFCFENKDDVFCFSLDKDRDRNLSKGDPVFPFLNPSVEGLCTKNDFIFVHQKKDQIHVLLIELKSKNPGAYLHQLKAGKAVFQFIVERIRLCKDNFKEIDERNIYYKGVLFFDRQIPEKPTSKKRQLDFDDTDNLPFPITKQSYGVYYLSQFLYKAI